MRPIPAPRRADALPMPAGDSRDWVVHPGPEQTPRYTVAPCAVRSVTVTLPAGVVLLDAVAAVVEAEKADGACAFLGGVRLAPMTYVMPDGPADDAHAAWYSETFVAQEARLDRATASVGRRDGAWFMHTHAMWQAETPGMGHLLNDQCTLAADCEVTLLLLNGAWLEVTPDPETNFPLFHPRRGDTPDYVQAGLLTIRPHQDLRPTIESACADLGLSNARIHGLGSLIGAGFAEGPSMAAPLSEILLLDGCAVRDGRCTALPLACVDPAGDIFQGDLQTGKGPVCVTFELLIVAD